MKRIIFIILLCVWIAPAAMAQNFTLTPNVKHATCTGNGSITVNVENSTDGATVVFAIQENNGTPQPGVSQTVSGTTCSYTFGSLDAGTYKIIVEETNGTTATQKELTATVEDHYQPIRIESLNAEEACGGIKCNVDLSAGTATHYDVYEVDENTNDTITPAVKSNLPTGQPFTVPFDKTPGDDYYKGKRLRVFAYNDCGEASVKDLAMNSTLVKYYMQNPSFQRLSCDSAKVGFRVYSTTGAVPAYRYPITGTVKVTTAGGGDSTYSFTQNNSGYVYDTIIMHGEISGRLVDYDITIEDACGETKTFDKYTNTSIYLTHTSAGACGGRYLRIYNSNKLPWKIKFTDYPAGFKPSENVNFTPGSDEATISKDTTSVSFGNSATAMPPGKYTAEITVCGQTVTKSTTITNNPSPPLSVSASLYPGCDEGSNYMQLYLWSNSRSVSMSKAFITDAPDEFKNDSGPLPYDVSSFFTDENKYVKMGNLPKGTYTFELSTDTCSPGRTKTRIVTIGEQNTETKVEIDAHCGTFDVKVSGSTNAYYLQFGLQKYNKEKGKWGHPNYPDEGSLLSGEDPRNTPSSSYDQVIGNGTSFANYGNGSSFTQVPFSIEELGIEYTDTVKYRVVVYQRGFSSTGTYTYCPRVLKEFEISDAEPKIEDYYVYACEGNIANLVIDATSLHEPLTYQIIAKDGTSTNGNIQDKPVFLDLDRGSVYKVKVTDECTQNVSVSFETDSVRLPTLMPINICEGQDGFLFLPGTGFLDVSWLKNGEPTGVTGSTYPFTNFQFDTDGGIYEAQVKYKKDNGEWSCISEVFDVDLNHSPYVYAGKSALIPLCSDTETVTEEMLFDALLDNPDTFGIWTPQPVGGPGVYTYTVSKDTVCGPLTSTATVTVSIGNDLDQDGIGDHCDQDDDNDGILDSNECFANQTDSIDPTTANSTTFAQISVEKGDIVSVAWGDSDVKPFTAVAGDLHGEFITNALKISDTTLMVNGRYIYKKNKFLTEKTDGSYYKAYIDVNNNGTHDAGEDEWDIYADSTFKASSAGTVNFYFDDDDYTDNEGKLMLSISKGCDTDGDGIVNSLDLDSDNDGCPDAFEGSGQFKGSDCTQLNTDGGVYDSNATPAQDYWHGDQTLCHSASCVDANGVPTVAGAAGQAVGSSQEAVKFTVEKAWEKDTMKLCAGAEASIKINVSSLQATKWKADASGRLLPDFEKDTLPAPFTYGWQKRSSNTETWMPLSGSWADYAHDTTGVVELKLPLGTISTDMKGNEYRLQVYSSKNVCDTVYTYKIIKVDSLKVNITDNEKLTCLRLQDTLRTQSTGDLTMPLMYRWRMKEPSGASFDSTLVSVKDSVIVDKPGIYEVKITNANGCSDSTFVTVEQDIAKPVGTVEGNEKLTCKKPKITLTAKPDAGVTYKWLKGTAEQSTNQTWEVGEAGDYSAVLVSLASGCVDTVKVTVLEDKKTPAVTISGAADLSCGNRKIYLTSSVTQGDNETYQWSKDGEELQNASASDYEVTETGTYKVIVTNANGCVGETSETIGGDLSSCVDVEADNDLAETDNNTPVEGNVITNDKGTELLVTKVNINGTETTVSASGSTIIDLPEGTLEIDEDGSYTFTPAEGFEGEVPDITYTITDKYGNEDDAILKIKVKGFDPDDMIVPDVITPDGNGINDSFIIDGLENYPNNTMLIFNRWGNKVFEANPYKNNWKGEKTFGISINGGKILPEGTYFYILQLDKDTVKKGYIYLKR